MPTTNIFTIFLIYLFYGAVFFAIGVAITSRHKTLKNLRIAGTFWLFSSFAFLHAFHEWMEMFLRISPPPQGDMLLLIHGLNIFLVFFSFLFLLLFGVTLIILIKPRLNILLWGLSLFLVGSVLLFLILHHPPGQNELIAFIDYDIRRIIGFPATITAGIAFLVYARHLKILSRKGAGNFTGAGIALFVYGAFTGLTPSTTPMIAGIPVEFFRGLSALVILHFIMYGLDTFLNEREETIAARLQRGARAERLGALGRLAAGIAHEINNPLANVSLQLEMLHNELQSAELPAGSKERLEIIAGSIDKTSTIARELLLFASDQNIALVVETCDIREIVNNAWQLIAPRSDNYRLGIDLDNDRLRGVPLKLEELFVNLFLNAMDAMPEGGGIEVSGHSDAGNIIIMVRDHGNGISAEKLNLVMEPFFTTREIGKGTGLGLSICYGIMEIHGGSIVVDSPPGVGTTVTLRFPSGGQDIV